MLDDVKIILAEYRLALKKNNIFNENKKYILLVIIVLIFAVWFIPRINNRIKSDKIIESNRTEKIINHLNCLLLS